VRRNVCFFVGNAVVWALLVIDGGASYQVVQGRGVEFSLSLLVDEAVYGIFELNETFGDIGAGVLRDG
jgi:hypothetical protein